MNDDTTTTAPTTAPEDTHLMDLIAGCLDDAQGPHGTIVVATLPDGSGWLMDATSVDGTVSTIVRPDGTAVLAHWHGAAPLTGAALTIAATIIATRTGTQLPDKS